MTARRDFLGFTAGAVAARTVLPLAAHAEASSQLENLKHPDAALIAACERHPALLAAYNAALDDDNDSVAWKGEGPAAVAYDASRDLIRNAQPVTMAGVMAKVRAARVEGMSTTGEEREFLCDGHAWAWDVLADLLRLAGGGT